MEFYRKGFPKIIPDNDNVYLEHLRGVIESVDEYSSVEVTKTPHSYNFRIVPSVPKYTQSILREIMRINTLYGIYLEFSKSIRTSSTIIFSIEV